MPKHLNPLVPRVLVKQLAVCPYYVFSSGHKCWGAIMKYWFMTGSSKKMGNMFLQIQQHCEKNIKAKITQSIPALQFLYVPSMRSEKTDEKKLQEFCLRAFND